MLCKYHFPDILILIDRDACFKIAYKPVSVLREPRATRPRFLILDGAFHSAVYLQQKQHTNSQIPSVLLTKWIPRIMKSQMIANVSKPTNMDVHFVRTFSTHGVHVIHTTHHNGQIILCIPTLRKTNVHVTVNVCN